MKRITLLAQTGREAQQLAERYAATRPDAVRNDFVKYGVGKFHGFHNGDWTEIAIRLPEELRYLREGSN